MKLGGVLVHGMINASKLLPFIQSCINFMVSAQDVHETAGAEPAGEHGGVHRVPDPNPQGYVR
jgi:hypothetical protein